MKRATSIVLTLVVVALASPAGASDAPTAKDLVRKLMKAGFCADLELVDAQEREVVCTPRGTTIPIRVTAMSSPAAARRALDAERRDACSLVEDLGTPMADFTLAFPVGGTWFVAADSRSVPLNKVAKLLGGKVKTYRCT